MVVSKKVIDLIERVGFAFIAGFISVYLYAIISSGSTVGVISNGEILDTALTAGIGAIVPLVAGLIGFKVGDKDNASLVSIKKPEPTPSQVQDFPQESPAPINNYSQEG